MTPPRPSLGQSVHELHKNRTIAWIAFAALLALIGVIHLFRNAINIDHRELWLDESSTYMVAQYPFPRLLTLPIEFHSQPPLYYVLLHGLSRLSSAESVIRGMSWLFCLLLAGYAMLELRELRVISRVAFCLLFIGNGFTLFLSRELRPYALSALLSFVSSVIFLRFARSPRSLRLAALYVIVATAQAYTLAFDVWVLVAQGLFGAGVIVASLVREGPRRGLRESWPIAAALAVVAVLYLPYLRLVTKAAPPVAHPPTKRAIFDEAFKFEHVKDALERFTEADAPYSWILWGLILFGIAREIRRRDFGFVLWLLVFFGQIVFVYGFLHGRLPVAFRYLTPAFPALLMGAAIGVDHLVPKRPARLVPALLLTLGLVAYQGRKPFRDYLKASVPQPNWRKLYAEMKKIPGKKAIFFDTGFYAQNLEYVARRDRDFTYLNDGYERLAGTGMSAGGALMTRAYVERMIEEEQGRQRCFFYATDKRVERSREKDVYGSVFVPAMERLGYTKAFTQESGKVADPMHDYYMVNGYCRPALPAAK